MKKIKQTKILSYISYKLKIPNKTDLNKIIFGKYEIIKKIGQSSYSSVFLGKYINKKNYVAIKVQDKNAFVSELEKEAYYQYILRGFGIPKILSFGKNRKYNILVETLLGKTIYEYFTKNKNANTKMKDLCMVAIQIIDRIQYIHSKNIIHQDIKPENFLVGNPDKSIIYIIDFGLSKKYRSSRTGKHISFSKNNKFYGTMNFSSINAMKGYQMSRRDDMISIGYMLIYLINGKLPWSILEKGKLERFRKILSIKSNTTNEELCKYLPIEFYEYMNYVKSLKFEEKPNYIYLRKLFLSVLDKMNDKYDLKFSWIKSKNIKKQNNNLSTMSSLNSYRRKSSPFYNILHNLRERSSMNKTMNTENEIFSNNNNKKKKFFAYKTKDNNYYDKRSISVGSKQNTVNNTINRILW